MGAAKEDKMKSNV